MTTICITENTSQQNGAAADSVITGVYENSIRDNDTAVNYSTGWDSCRTDKAGGIIMRSIFSFDLSGIPAGATINSANLYLYLASIYYKSSTSQLDTHRIKVSWNKTQSTWADRATSTAWTTAGALSTSDIDTTASDTNVIDTSSYATNPGAYEPALSVTQVIQDIIDDGTDNGFLLGATKTAWIFYGSHYTDGSRPELLIDYTPLPTAITTLCLTDNTTQQNGAAADSLSSGKILDTEIDEDAPTTTHHTSYSMYTVNRGVSDGDRKCYLKFDISGIPAGQTITSAQLYLYNLATYYESSLTTFSAYRVKQAAVNDQLTWDDYATSSAWTGGGATNTADIDLTASATAAVDMTSADGAYVTLMDIGDLVQEWYDGTHTNNGMLFWSDEAQTQWRTSDATDGQRAELLITYEAITATDHILMTGTRRFNPLLRM